MLPSLTPIILEMLLADHSAPFEEILTTTFNSSLQYFMLAYSYFLRIILTCKRITRIQRNHSPKITIVQRISSMRSLFPQY